MLTGTIGAAADMDKLVGVKALEVGQQVKLLRLGNLLRRDIAHLPSLPLARRPLMIQFGSQFFACHGSSTPLKIVIAGGFSV